MGLTVNVDEENLKMRWNKIKKKKKKIKEKNTAGTFFLFIRTKVNNNSEGRYITKDEFCMSNNSLQFTFRQKQTWKLENTARQLLFL